MTHYVGIDASAMEAAEGVQKDLVELVLETGGEAAAQIVAALPQATIARVITRNHPGHWELLRAAKAMSRGFARHAERGCNETFLVERELVVTALKKAGVLSLDANSLPAGDED